MARCKYCNHYNVCKYSSMRISPGTKVEDLITDCVDYKDNSQYIELPCKVKDLIDRVIGHNQIVGIWEKQKQGEEYLRTRIWQGMAHEIPKKYLDRIFVTIFGTVPESIIEADTINIEVVSTSK